VLLSPGLAECIGIAYRRYQTKRAERLQRLSDEKHNILRTSSLDLATGAAKTKARRSKVTDDPNEMSVDPRVLVSAFGIGGLIGWTVRKMIGERQVTTTDPATLRDLFTDSDDEDGDADPDGTRLIGLIDPHIRTGVCRPVLNPQT